LPQPERQRQKTNSNTARNIMVPPPVCNGVADFLNIASLFWITTILPLVKIALDPARPVLNCFGGGCSLHEE
jgi:hypothetical protein